MYCVKKSVSLEEKLKQEIKRKKKQEGAAKDIHMDFALGELSTMHKNAKVSNLCIRIIDEICWP